MDRFYVAAKATNHAILSQFQRSKRATDLFRKSSCVLPPDIADVGAAELVASTSHCYEDIRVAAMALFTLSLISMRYADEQPPRHCRVLNHPPTMTVSHVQ